MAPHTSLTESIARWVHELSPSDIPDDVREHAIGHILDAYGLALSGRTEESWRILASHLNRFAGVAEAHCIGSAERVSAEAAALGNGLAMHAMDFDDTQLATVPETVYGLLTHPTTPVLAAASAGAELVGASGRALVTAYVAGVEVACRVADAIAPRHYLDGFHSTGTIGVFGAAAAAGKLLGLSPLGLQYGFGIAAPLGGGYRENFGTMTKPLQAGQAAAAGVFAARLASGGFTSAANVLEAPRGFFRAAGGGYEPDRIEQRLGAPFYFADPGISVKPYPSGSLSHPGQEAVLRLVEEHDVRPEDLESATAFTNSAMPTALIYAQPQTALEAKFSFPFFLAVAIARRRCTMNEFTDEVVQHPILQELMQRCRHVADPDIDTRGFHSLETRIEIVLKDGRVLERTERTAKGHPEKPMTKAELEEKFRQCAAGVLPDSVASQAIDMIWAVESAPDLTTLHRLLAADAVLDRGTVAG